MSDCLQEIDHRFAALGAPKRIWAVSSIHSDVERIAMVHDRLYKEFRAGDRIVYLGNMIGFGESTIETLDEILGFRRAVLSLSGVVPKDITYVKGLQEDLLHQLMQLQFYANATELLEWMLHNGVAPVLEAYGMGRQEAMVATHHGTLALTQWSARLRSVVQRHEGHAELFRSLKRAAFTSEHLSAPLLFVHAGLDPSRPVFEQGDALWCPTEDIEKTMLHDYDPFVKVIRGRKPDSFDYQVRVNCRTATLDGGCGFGGPLMCAGFETMRGSVFHMIKI